MNMNMNKGSNQNNMNYPNMPDMTLDNRVSEDYMYPEVYHKFAPVADQIIKDMEKKYGDIYMSEDMLNQMVEEAIRRSGADNMNEMPYNANANDGDKDGEAIPTMRRYGGRHYGHFHGGDGWRYYDRGALSDIFSILFLNQIFGRRRHNWRW